MQERELLDLWGAPVAVDDATPLGDHNRTLLRLWRAEFGDRLECVADCPACGERLEADVSAGALLAGEVRSLPPGLQQPTLADLDAVSAFPVDVAKAELARRCGSPDAEFVSAALEAADPQVALRLALRCPACEAAFSAVVDVAAHVNSAIDRRARALLGEVAELAAAFGWTEDEVLALPPVRRRAYAEWAAR